MHLVARAKRGLEAVGEMRNAEAFLINKQHCGVGQRVRDKNQNGQSDGWLETHRRIARLVGCLIGWF
jgi:hypothetical protein